MFTSGSPSPLSLNQAPAPPPVQQGGSQNSIIYGILVAAGLALVGLSIAGAAPHGIAQISQSAQISTGLLGGGIVISAVVMWKGERIVKAIKSLPQKLQALKGWAKKHPLQLFCGILMASGVLLFTFCVAGGLMHSGHLPIPKHAFHKLSSWSSTTYVSATVTGLIMLILGALLFRRMRKDETDHQRRSAAKSLSPQRASVYGGKNADNQCGRKDTELNSEQTPLGQNQNGSDRPSLSPSPSDPVPREHVSQGIFNSSQQFASGPPRNVVKPAAVYPVSWQTPKDSPKGGLRHTIVSSRYFRPINLQ